MQAPRYRWTCHVCEKGNEPGLSNCAHCAFPAVASAGEIAAARGEPDPTPGGYRVLLKSLAWLLALLPWGQ